MGTAALGPRRDRTARPSVLVAVATAVTLVAGMVGAATPAAAEPAAPSVITGWLPSWSTQSALSGIEDNENLVGEASPFWYTARASSGTVSLSASTSATTMATVLDSLRSRGIKVIPSIADGSAARAMATVLKDPEDRAAHVAQIVDLVVSNGYDGIELDYEKFAFSDGSSTWATTRPAWVAFVAALGNALHAAKRVLALAVPPIYNGDRTSGSGYWVYDYKAVAPYVDSLRIMTYDYSVSRPGPIAPLSFIRRTLDYAVSAFPAGRIRMGLPAYGRLWVARRADGSPAITGKCPASGVPGTRSFTTAAARDYLTSIAGSTPSVRFDATTAEAVATFRKKYSGKAADGSSTTCTVDHEAWWMNARGVAARLPLLSQYGLEGAAVWHLGGLDQASWTRMQKYASGLPATSTSSDTRVPVKVRVRADTYEPLPGQTFTMRVRIRPRVPDVLVMRQKRLNGRWYTLAKERTNARGKVRFVVQWPNRDMTIRYRIKTRKTARLASGRSERFTISTR